MNFESDNFILNLDLPLFSQSIQELPAFYCFAYIDSNIICSAIPKYGGVKLIGQREHPAGCHVYQQICTKHNNFYSYIHKTKFGTQKALLFMHNT